MLQKQTRVTSTLQPLLNNILRAKNDANLYISQLKDSGRDASLIEKAEKDLSCIESAERDLLHTAILYEAEKEKGKSYDILFGSTSNLAKEFGKLHKKLGPKITVLSPSGRGTVIDSPTFNKISTLFECKNNKCTHNDIEISCDNTLLHYGFPGSYTTISGENSAHIPEGP